MRRTVEFAIMAVTTNKVFPKIFKDADAAEDYKSKRSDPAHWKVVRREVTYGEWENVNHK